MTAVAWSAAAHAARSHRLCTCTCQLRHCPHCCCQVTISYIELAATRQERRASLLQQYYFDLDGPGAPPGPATGQAAQPPGMSAEEPRPGLLLSKTQAAVAPWRTDPMDADLTQVDADGKTLVPCAGPPTPSLGAGLFPAM